jgi:hypothetical protein
MFRRLAQKFARDADYPARVREHTILRAVLDGTIYDVLPYEFYEEYNDAGEYVPLRNRAPSVRSNLCRVVVEDSVALLFGERHFPAVVCEDEAVRAALETMIRETLLNAVMVDGATRGSVGSVVFRMRILKRQLCFDVMDTAFLTPAWDPDAPDRLLRVTERYKVKGADLLAQGYGISPDAVGEDHWFQRAWDAQAETWYLPQPRDETGPMRVDEERSVRHGLGFVPMVWVRNLPGGDEIDGACTFRFGIEDAIAIDYQMSQAGRGLSYSSDPTFVVKEPAGEEAGFVRSASNALIVSKDGDAKVLEISGTASGAVIEYCRAVREMALEAMHGNRADPQRFSGAQSGRALEWLNQGLVSLADKLRISYGEGALLSLLKMAMRASRVYPVRIGNKEVVLNEADVSLRWPPWYAPTWQDRQAQATATQTLINAGVLSMATGTALVGHTYDIPDVPAERERIGAELMERRELEQRAGETKASAAA